MPVPASRLCFQQVPRAVAAGYSCSNREQSILRSTTLLLTGSRRSNLRQPCSNPRGVLCPPYNRCRRQRGLCSGQHSVYMEATDGKAAPEGGLRIPTCLTVSWERPCDLAPRPPKEPYQGNLQPNHRHEYRPVAGADRNTDHLKRKLSSLFYSVRCDHHLHRRTMSPQPPCNPHFTKDDEGQENLCRESS